MCSYLTSVTVNAPLNYDWQWLIQSLKNACCTVIFRKRNWITCSKLIFYKNDYGVKLHVMRHILYFNVVIIVDKYRIFHVCDGVWFLFNELCALYRRPFEGMLVCSMIPYFKTFWNFTCTQNQNVRVALFNLIQKLVTGISFQV